MANPEEETVCSSLGEYIALHQCTGPTKGKKAHFFMPSNSSSIAENQSVLYCKLFILCPKKIIAQVLLLHSPPPPPFLKIYFSIVSA